jgi:hypothetical protein
MPLSVAGLSTENLLMFVLKLKIFPAQIPDCAAHSRPFSVMALKSTF